MHVRSTAAGWSVFAPAKLNLFLEVLGKRADGFHEIETLMVPISLYDTVEFRSTTSDQIELTCESVAAHTPAEALSSSLPPSGENLVTRAVRLLRERAGVTWGASLRLVKRIPIAAGLAGGSSDAAAALLAANRGWNLGWSREQLSRVAAELGSDIPFFFGRGPALCTGRGERIERLAGLGQLHFVVVHPPAGLSTADVYRACRPAAAPHSATSLIAALRRGSPAQAARWLFNRLQPAATGLSPWIERLRTEFSHVDCLGHLMSGSGTSYFGVCRHARHARRIAARLQTRGVGQVYAVAGC
jgi:4-diphosphocytidyl-2-C-methyl-D-erythritol kinase